MIKLFLGIINPMYMYYSVGTKFLALQNILTVGSCMQLCTHLYNTYPCVLHCINPNKKRYRYTLNGYKM